MNLRTKIDLIFVVTTIIVAVLLHVTFQNVNYVKGSSDLVNNTNKFLYSLANLESSVVQIEASSRGYIISGKEEYLDKLSQAKTDAFYHLVESRNLHTDDDHQIMHHFDEFKKLLNEKIKVSEAGVTIRKNENIENAIRFVSSGKGTELMEQIQAIIKDIEREEFALLSIRINENKVHAVNQNNIIKVLSLCIFSLILIFHLHIRKNTFKAFWYKEKQSALIKELNYQNKQLDDFVDIISHNVRSPANNITSLVSLLDDKSNADQQKMILEKLGKVSANLNETLDELIEVIHIKQNIGIKREEQDFRKVCEKVIDSLQGDIISKDAVITYNFDDSPMVIYPKTYLESIFHNLLSNALKYSSPNRKPEIQITTKEVDGTTVLKVSDNGLGMDLKRIGDKIFGLRKTFHTTHNAKGIGLFMTKTHIETLGGEIKVESEVNKGTTFTVIFDKKKEEQPLEEPYRLTKRSIFKKITKPLPQYNE